jgi:hypothetical protein
VIQGASNLSYLARFGACRHSAIILRSRIMKLYAALALAMPGCVAAQSR